MCPDAHKVNDFRVIVNPYEKKSVLYVTLPASDILTEKTVTKITCRKRNVMEKILQDFEQCFHFARIVPVPFQVLFSAVL